MERKLLFLLLFCIATIVNAKSEPIITLKSVPQIPNYSLIGEMEH